MGSVHDNGRSIGEPIGSLFKPLKLSSQFDAPVGVLLVFEHSDGRRFHVESRDVTTRLAIVRACRFVNQCIDPGLTLYDWEYR